jgi:hypothetical protein
MLAAPRVRFLRAILTDIAARRSQLHPPADADGVVRVTADGELLFIETPEMEEPLRIVDPQRVIDSTFVALLSFLEQHIGVSNDPERTVSCRG